MIRKVVFLPPMALVVIGIILSSAPGAQAFRSNNLADFHSVQIRQTFQDQMSVAKKGDLLTVHLYAIRKEARKDRIDLARAKDKASDAAAAQQAQQAQQQQTAPSATVAMTTVSMSAFEACVISRESGGNPAAYNPVSGAGGLFQFLPSTWASLGFSLYYPGGAQTAPVSVQQQAFVKLYNESGTTPWAPYDGC